MAAEDVAALRARLMRDIREFANSGYRIVERTAPFADSTALQAAANQFRQAAKTLDQLDGLNQTITALKSK